jgi:hypothetical protein
VFREHRSDLGSFLFRTLYPIANQQIFFQKDPSRNFKKEQALKTLLKSSFMQNSALQHNVEIFSKKYQDFSGNQSSEFQKILNLSMQIHT